MSVSPIRHPVQTLANPETRKIMDFLCSKINDIFKKTDRTVQFTEFAKELFTSKKETIQETQTAILESGCGSVFDENTLKVFVLFLHRFPGSPMQEGLAYVKKAPGYDPVKGFQVSANWKKDKTISLPHIYKEQFFTWMLSNSNLSFNYTLLMLQILQSFDNLSVELDQEIWNTLSLQLEKKSQKQLQEFQAKYAFLISNGFLQSFPIEGNAIETTCSLQMPVRSQYKLWMESFQWVIYQLTGSVPILDGDQNSWEQLSNKMLAYRLKKILPFSQEKTLLIIEQFDQCKRSEEEISKDQSRLQQIKENQGEVQKLLNMCTQSDKKNISCIAKKSKEEIKNLHKIIEKFRKKCMYVKPEEQDALNKEFHKQLQANMFTKDGVDYVREYFTLENSSFEKSKSAIQARIRLDNLYPLKKDFLLIPFLMSHISHCTTRELTQCKEQREGLSAAEFDEMLEKLEAEPKKKPSRKQSKKISLPEPLDEPVCSISPTPVFLETKESISPAMDKMQIYLDSREKRKQLNGCLSQSVEKHLQPAKSYLCQTMQGKEVYDHVLLGASALEHLAQAIHDGRRDHVVLGFRSALIHCHFAIEQMLCRIILQQTGVYANSHNLVHLAEQLGKITKKSKIFLEEVRVHLWFHYPEDYRLYFTHNKNTPKAFALLNVLSQPKISRENIQEAMNFSFEKYYQTLEFIENFLESPLQDTSGFINKMKLLQKQLEKTGDPRFKKCSIFPCIRKIQTVEELLNTLNELTHVKDLEEGWLFAAFNTIKSYLQLMKISLETPQEASEHSLQKFLQVETLFNMDKLFKHLFRAISILRLGEDNRAHDLAEFFPLVGELSEEDKKLLKKINVNITHHYLHKSANAEWKEKYDDFLEHSRVLLSIDEGFSVFMNKREVSHETLQEMKKEIMPTISSSLDLLVKLVKPVVQELEKMHRDIEREIQKTVKNLSI